MSTVTLEAQVAYLAQACGAADTTLYVRGLKDARGNAITSMPAGITLVNATIEPTSSSNREGITFTGIVDQGNSIVALTGVTRNINPQPPHTALAATVPHANNVAIIFSNGGSFYDNFLQTDKDASVSATLTFDATKFPRVSDGTVSPTNDAEFATKKYVDGVVTAGAPDASVSTKGIAKMSVAPASAADPISVGDNDGRVPTQGENDALVGKSGTQVGTNDKFVDEAMVWDGVSTDVSQAVQNSAQKVGEANATGKANKIAQSFVAGKTPLKSVSLYKKANTGSFVGDVVVSVYTDNAGVPSVSLVGSVTIANATYNALTVDQEFTASFASDLSLNLGSTYWIVVTTTTSDNSNYINLAYQNSSVYASGALYRYNSTDSYVAIGGDLYFKTNINPNGKVPTVDSSGKLPAAVMSEQQVVTLTAGEAISAGQPVYLAQYPAADVSFDTKQQISGTGTVISGSVTVAANSNRYLIVAITNSTGAAAVSSVTYNGVAMTNLLAETNADSTGNYSVWYLLNPASGSNTLQMNFNRSVSAVANVYSYYNAAQQAPEISGSASGANYVWATVNLAPLTQRALIFTLSTARNNTGNNPTGSGWVNNALPASGYASLRTADSGAIAPIATKQVTIQSDYSGYSTWVWCWSIAAATSGASSRAYLTSASAAATCANYVGLATENGTAGNSMKVSVAGINANQSALSGGSKYYLSNTAGLLATAAGTVKVLVGIAKSATEMLMRTQISDASL